MSKFKVYTFYKRDGTKVPLYGSSVDDALTSAGYTTKQVIEEIRFCRKGFDDSLEFINGKWHTKNKPKVEIKVQEPDVFNQN
jgi:hypothetical protein